jgi:hypothetical protein
VNERIEELHERAGDGAGTFVCECPDDACLERLTVPIATHEEVRNDPHLFRVAPGHELPEIERTVENGPGYVVVRKDSLIAARIAEQTGPPP